MGIRSYVRDRKQVKASRAGEAAEKLSKGDFSIFGGQNGASIDPFSEEAGDNPRSWGPQPANQWYKNPKPKSEVEGPHYPKNANGSSWDEDSKDEFADMGYGRPGTSAENAEKEPETPGEEAARGARMPGAAGVTVLGPKHHVTGERTKLDGETRGRVRAANLEAKRKGESSDNDNYLPTIEDVERVKREDSQPKPKPRLKAWDE
jgi:hypothetical protein